jgi:6-phosphogluconolactonase (cycloisomerase 2 family)
VTGATSYNIYRSTSAGVATIPANKVNTGTVVAGPFANSGLTPNTLYYYVVTAIGPNGESGGSAEVSATTNMTAPTAPTGVTATAASSSQINIGWTNVTGATYYNIYRSATSPVNIISGNLIASAAAGPFGNSGLSADTTYFYKVTAVNNGGESVGSTEVSTTTMTLAPTGVSATPGIRQNALSWTATTGATSYNVYWSNTPGVSVATGTKIAGIGTNAYTHTILTAGTPYYYIITAVNAGGESAASAEVSGIPIPAAPTGVTATTASSTQIDIGWTSATGATYYNIYRSTSAGVAIIPANLIASAAAGPFGNSGLAPNTIYYYVVTSVGVSGESTGSTEVSATTNMTAPSAPTGVTATAASSSQINIGWTNVSGATYYNIYRSATSPVNIISGNLIASAAAGPFGNSGLSADTTYFYKVTAVNNGGESVGSAEVSTTTMTLPPAGSVVVVSGSTQNTISWTAVTGATSYNIYWSTTPGVTIATGTKITGVVSPYVHTPLTPGTAYYYIVTAVNAGGESAASAEGGGTIVLPAVPTGVAATSSTSTHIDVSWSAVTGATYYNIYRSTTSPVSTIPGNLIASTAAAAFGDSGLTANTIYYYRISAVNAGGETAGSTEASATTRTLAPTGLSITPGIQQNSLSWTAITGATSYNVYWSNTAGVTIATGTKITNATNPYTHTPLTVGTVYYYIVTAVNAGGESLASTEASGTPLYPVPTITSFTPASGAEGYTVTISGTNFIPTPASNTVRFNGTVATVTAASATSLTVTVPTGATSGTISVTNAGGTATSAASFSVYKYYVYVANSGSNNISAYNINMTTGALTAVAGSPFAAGTGPNAIAVDLIGKFVYVANNGSNNVSAYAINTATGALSAVAGSPFGAGNGPIGVAVDSTGQFAYVSNNNSNNVSAYTINATTGALSAVTGSPFGAGTGPNIVAVDPTGKFVYVPNTGVLSLIAGNISAYNINATTGALSTVTGSPFATGLLGSLFGVSVDPSGQYVYVTHSSNKVYAYTINATTGALSAVTGSPFNTGAGPNIVITNPTGQYAYVANSGSNNISVYTINGATGALSAITGSPFAAGSSPWGIVIDPTGQYAYVTNSGAATISAYTVNGATGALSAMAGSPFAAGSSPFGVTVIEILQ